MQTVLETALLWRSLGVSCIPILHRGKRPAISHWREYQYRLPTDAELRRWFIVQYNIAVLCGGPRRIVVVDWDSRLAYSTWIAGMKARVFSVLHMTYHVSTARGHHVYLRVSEDEDLQSRKFESVDIKGAGGYVLAPPSIHPSGIAYTGFGNPRHILEVGDLRIMLGNFWREPEVIQQRAGRPMSDPFADAMRDTVDLGGVSIEDILDRVDLVDLVRSAGAQLRQRGREWRSACPLHGGDNREAFVIYPDGGHMRWKCFTNCPAPAGGDALDFYAAWKGMNLQEAMSELAKEVR